MTHIVVQDDVKEPRELLSRAKLDTIDDVPERIPILRWAWAEESQKKRSLQPIHQFPAFKTRITFPPGYVPPSPPPDSEPRTQPSRKASTARTLPKQTRQSDSEDSNDSGDEKIRYVLPHNSSSTPRGHS